MRNACGEELHHLKYDAILSMLQIVSVRNREGEGILGPRCRPVPHAGRVSSAAVEEDSTLDKFQTTLEKIDDT